MKLRVEVDGRNYTLDLQPNGDRSEYTLRGAGDISGTAYVVEVMPGLFSVLLNHSSFSVRVAPRGDDLDVWVEGQRHTICIADARDRTGKDKKIAGTGPMEIRAQMPGRVIKLLAAPGAHVVAGQGVIVVEAMKMQNEMKSPRDGVISKILVGEGATVAAGETLVVIE